MIGRVLEGYRIDAELGRGGQAVVYRATQLSLQRVVALKVVTPTISADDTFLQRFRREGIAAASLEHPNIIPVYEAGDADGLAFLAMKFVDGPSLDAVMRGAGGITPQRSMFVVGQVADALDHAHARGLVHRDVKPANILLDSSDHAYLTDFGLTRAIEGSRLTQSGTWMGTLEYVAPEQIRGEEVTGAADRYALAVVAYECLTGHGVFNGTDRAALLYAHVHEPPVPPTGRRPDLGTAVDAVFARALDKDPARRHDTAAAFASELETALQAGPAWSRPFAATRVDQPIPAVAAQTPSATVVDGPGSPPPPPPVSGPGPQAPASGPAWFRVAAIVGAAVAALLVVVLVVSMAGDSGSGHQRTVTVRVP
ncbi:MAG: serine/threonine-protein kinase [Thermoleophilia bacterium]